jgi:hypothetical protein
MIACRARARAGVLGWLGMLCMLLPSVAASLALPPAETDQPCYKHAGGIHLLRAGRFPFPGVRTPSVRQRRCIGGLGGSPKSRAAGSCCAAAPLPRTQPAHLTPPFLCKQNHRTNHNSPNGAPTESLSMALARSPSTLPQRPFGATSSSPTPPLPSTPPPSRATPRPAARRVSRRSPLRRPPTADAGVTHLMGLRPLFCGVCQQRRTRHQFLPTQQTQLISTKVCRAALTGDGVDTPQKMHLPLSYIS